MISLGLWIAGLLGRKAVTDKAAKSLGLAAALIVGIPLAILLIWGGIKLHDRGVVEVYQDKRDAAVSNATVAADREALANALERAEVAEAEDDAIGNAMVEAKAKDPERGTREVGPVQQSYFDTLPKRRN